MKTITTSLISTFLVCCSISGAWAQRDSILKYFTFGKENYRQQKYYEAILDFRLAKNFDGSSADLMLDTWISKSFDGYVVLLKQAEEKSSRLARASELAGLAYKLAKNNPTHAIRLAEYAVNEDPKSRSAVQQLHDIASSFPASFYSLDLKTVNETSTVSASCISPDEKYFLTADTDKTIRLWDMTGQLIQAYNGHQEKIMDIEFFPDGKAFISAGMDNVMKIWSLDGTLLNTITGHRGDVVAVKVSRDGKTIASASNDKSFCLWAPDGKRLLKIENAHDDFLSDIDLSSDGKFILTAGWDKTAKIWGHNGTLTQTFKGHSGVVSSACFSPDGTLVLTGSWDQTARLWDRNGASTLVVLSGLSGHQAAVNKVSFHTDGLSFFTGGDDNQIKRWDKNGALLQTYKGHQSTIQTFHCSHPGNYLVSSAGYISFIWPLNGSLLQTTKIDSASIRAIAVTPDGKTIASGLNTGEIAVWDDQGNLLKRYKAHGQPTTSIACSPLGDRFISGSEEDFAKIWDFNGNLLSELKNPGGDINAVAWSSQNNFLATAGWGGEVLLWDTQGGFIKSLDASSTKGRDNRVYGLAFSPDGKLITAATRYGEVYMWNIETEEKTVLKGHLEAIVFSVAFSPDGKLIASGSVDRTVRLWNTKGEEILKLEGHLQTVHSLAFSPDGQWLLSGGLDNLVKLWRLDGAEAFSFYNHAGRVNTVAFSPDGTAIYSGSEDQTSNKWMTLETYLKSGKIRELDGSDRIKYGLEKSQLSKPVSTPLKADDDFFIDDYEKKIIFTHEMRHYYNVSMKYSRKAWAASDALERLQYQQKSILRCKKAFELLGNAPKPEIAGILAYYYANQSLWYLMNHQSDQALESINEALKLDVIDHISALLRAKLALVSIFNNRTEEAKQIIEEVKELVLDEKIGYSQLTNLLAGFTEKKDVRIGEIILKDIDMLERAGITHPDLAEFRKILEIRS